MYSNLSFALAVFTMEPNVKLEHLRFEHESIVWNILQVFGFLPISTKNLLQPPKLNIILSHLPKCFCIIWIFLLLSIGVVYVTTPIQEIRAWIEGFGTKGTQFFVFVYFTWDAILITVFTVSRADLLIKRADLQNLFISLLHTAEFIASAPFVSFRLIENLKRSCKIRKYIAGITILLVCVLSFLMFSTAFKVADMTKTNTLLDAIQSSITYVYFCSSMLMEYFVVTYIHLLNTLLEQFEDNKILESPRNFSRRMVASYERIEQEVASFNRLFGLRMTLEVLWFCSHTMICGFFTATGDIQVGGLNTLVINSSPLLILGFSILRVCKASAKVTEKSKQFAQKLGNQMDESKQYKVNI